MGKVVLVVMCYEQRGLLLMGYHFVGVNDMMDSGVFCLQSGFGGAKSGFGGFDGGFSSFSSFSRGFSSFSRPCS